MKFIQNFFILVLLVSIGSFTSTAQQDYSILFKEQTMQPAAYVDASSFVPSEKEVVNGKYYRFIQFESIPTVAEHEALKKDGIRLLDYVPHNTYLCSINEDFQIGQLKTSKIRTAFSLSASQKWSEDLANQALPEYAIQGDKAHLIMSYYRDLEYRDVLTLCAAQGIEIVEGNGINNYIIIAVNLADVSKVRDLPFVQYISAIAEPPRKDDRRGRSLHRVNKIDPNIAGASVYTGKGINVLVRDDGEIFDHLDYTGRLHQSLVGESRGGHGDGVAGVMAGAGNLIPENRGMAHGSDIWVLDYTSSFLDNTMPLFQDEDVIVTNSSYSDGCNVGYTSNTRIVDQQLFNNPTLMHVFSAGNDGESNCNFGAGVGWGNITGGHKQGKNPITVANVDYLGQIMPSSSRGPSYDGRIKPDIAANGNNHLSTADEEQDYISFGGTSGAAPVVAGVMAMLHEAYEVNHGERANAALLKAAMLNTANDLGNKGPDFIYGWGLLNGYKALRTIEESRFTSGVIAQGESIQFDIEIPEGVAEVRVMTYWPDKEAAQFSNTILLNDFTTSLTSSTGEVTLPWILDPSPNVASLNAPATKGLDFRNNMEQVAIDNPSAGTYTLDVEGTFLPFGEGEYYIVWDFRMDEIDVIFPDGGETLNLSSREVIHWDAEGDEGEFEVSLINSAGEETFINTVLGHNRLLEWTAPSTMDEFSKIRITRNGVVGESVAPFIIADNPENLEVIDWDSIPRLVWNEIDTAVRYDIYVLGEKYMEKIASVDTNFYEFPDSIVYRWAAATAIYENGTETKRSMAVPLVPPPVAVATIDAVDNKPCVNTFVKFESMSQDTLAEYNWQFGSGAIPASADTKGPHFVIYPNVGPNIAQLTLTNEGGQDAVTFIMQVLPEPINVTLDASPNGFGEFDFSTGGLFGETYTWEFGDGNTAEGKEVSHVYAASGTYTVCITVENACGILKESMTVVADLETAVEDLKEQDFVISPNPNRGDFSIVVPDLEGEDLKVELQTIDGKNVFTRNYSNIGIGHSIPLTDISNGIYIVKMTIGSATLSKKVVVEK